MILLNHMNIILSFESSSVPSTFSPYITDIRHIDIQVCLLPPSPSFTQISFRLQMHVGVSMQMLPSVELSVLLDSIQCLTFSVRNDSHHGSNRNSIYTCHHLLGSSHSPQSVVGIGYEPSHRIYRQLCCCIKIQCQQIRFRLIFP